MLERPAHVKHWRFDHMAEVDVFVIDPNLSGENDAALGAKIVKSRRQVRGERSVGLGRRDKDVVGHAILIMKLASLGWLAVAVRHQPAYIRRTCNPRPRCQPR